MPVDLLFELGYLLSDKTGVEVRVVSYNYDKSSGVLCVKASIEGAVREACIPVRQCKGVAANRVEKCLAKAITSDEKKISELAESLLRED